MFKLYFDFTQAVKIYIKYCFTFEAISTKVFTFLIKDDLFLDHFIWKALQSQINNLVILIV